VNNNCEYYPTMDSERDVSCRAPDPLLMGEIVPRLWIGNLQSLREVAKLHTSVTVISVLKSDTLLHFARTAVQQESIAECVRSHVEWELQDDAQADFVSPKLESILRAMDAALAVDDDDGNDASNNSNSIDNRGACLVHCAFGVSRSAAVCAAWLISRRHFSLPQALETIRQARPGASPNIGFIAGLRALEQCDGRVDAAIERLRPKNQGKETG